MESTWRILFPWPVATTPRNGDVLYGWVESPHPPTDPNGLPLHTLIILGFSRAETSAALRGTFQAVCAADPSLQRSLLNCGGRLVVCGRWGEGGWEDAGADELWISCRVEAAHGFPRLSKVASAAACSRLHVVFYKPPTVGERHLAVESNRAWSDVLAMEEFQPLQDRFPLNRAVEIVNLCPSLNAMICTHLKGTYQTSSGSRVRRQAGEFHGVPASLLSSKRSLSETDRHLFVMFRAARWGVSPHLPWNVCMENRAHIRKWHFWFTVFVQWTMGVLLCIFLLHISASMSATFEGCIPIFRRFMREHIAWLSGAPAGIKLHLELAELYAWVSTLVMETSASGFKAAAPYVPAVVGIISICSCIGGVGLGLALLADVLSIVTMPVTIMHLGMSCVYSYQLKFLGITWRLLRGHHSSRDRKLKQRRQRNRSNMREASNQDYGEQNVAGPDKKKKDDEVLMEHLIVGVLLFTPLLALLPTTLVFYVFFLVLNLSTAAASFMLTIVSDVLLANPLFFLMCRIARPGLFPGRQQFHLG